MLRRRCQGGGGHFTSGNRMSQPQDIRTANSSSRPTVLFITLPFRGFPGGAGTGSHYLIFRSGAGVSIGGRQNSRRSRRRRTWRRWRHRPTTSLWESVSEQPQDIRAASSSTPTPTAMALFITSPLPRLPWRRRFHDLAPDSGVACQGRVFSRSRSRPNFYPLEQRGRITGPGISDIGRR